MVETICPPSSRRKSRTRSGPARSPRRIGGGAGLADELDGETTSVVLSVGVSVVKDIGAVPSSVAPESRRSMPVGSLGSAYHGQHALARVMQFITCHGNKINIAVNFC